MYCGITIDWDYAKKVCLFMPEYCSEALQAGYPMLVDYRKIFSRLQKTSEDGHFFLHVRIDIFKRFV